MIEALMPALDRLDRRRPAELRSCRLASQTAQRSISAGTLAIKSRSQSTACVVTC